MFRTLKQKILPNPLEGILRRAKRKGHRTFLLGWNRGLGDIALGLYGLVHRIREVIPDAEITFVIRENLQEGFQLLEGVHVIIDPTWKRGAPYDVRKSVDASKYDVVINWPDPGYWLKWQRGKLTPKLAWEEKWEVPTNLANDVAYIGVQLSAETDYGHWRNWGVERWKELFSLLEKDPVKILLFGYGDLPKVKGDRIIDLRGKTDLFTLLTIIKRHCSDLILPDSGILSMAYYLDASFPINVISLWGDPRHGILKQAVKSPNPLLTHVPFIGNYKDLSSVSAEKVYQRLVKKCS